MNYKQQIGAIVGALTGLSMVYGGARSAVYRVDPGHKAFKFNKISGV